MARGIAQSPGVSASSGMRRTGVIGQHEVRIANDQEMITLKHDAFDRDIFAKGAVNAAVWAHNKEPGIYSMKDVLNIDP